MEAKLKAFRAQKRRQAAINQFKERVFNMVSFQAVRTNGDNVIVQDVNNPIWERASNDIPLQLNRSFTQMDEQEAREGKSTRKVSGEGLELETISLSSEDEEESNELILNEEPTSRSFATYFVFFLWFCFWVTCYIIAIELKFGLVYLLFSALFGIYFNTRTTPKAKNEVSAYSVFNKDCHAIDGTLNAEQFEREIRYGPANVR